MILVRTNHPCLRAGHHTQALLHNPPPPGLGAGTRPQSQWRHDLLMMFDIMGITPTRLEEKEYGGGGGAP
jgi:hypothetical protein